AAALGDRLGRRRVFAGGLALFAVASGGCALAPDTGVLIAARAVQGAGAATIMPMALALLNGAFPPARRGWAIGIYGSVTGLAAGAAAGLAFVAWERRAASPMLPPHLFRSLAFSAGNAVIFLLNASLTGAVFLMPQFQQVVAGQDPLSAGLRLLPWGIAPFL